MHTTEELQRMSEEHIFIQYPGMRFEWELVRGVCSDYCLALRENELRVFGNNPSLYQFLSTFRTSSARHEFLVHYAFEWHKLERRTEKQIETELVTT